MYLDLQKQPTVWKGGSNSFAASHFSILCMLVCYNYLKQICVCNPYKRVQKLFQNKLTK